LQIQRDGVVEFDRPGSGEDETVGRGSLAATEELIFQRVEAQEGTPVLIDARGGPRGDARLDPGGGEAELTARRIGIRGAETAAAGEEISDRSTDGDVVDPSGDGDPGNDSTPTAVSFPAAAVSGEVWLDKDGNGRRGPRDTSLSGILVTLFAAGDDEVFGTGDDLEVATTRTASPFSFSDVAPGTYLISVDQGTLPEKAMATHDFDGGLDSQAVVTLAAGVELPVDFGYGQEFNLALAMTGAGSLTIGGTYEFTLSVTNDGPGEALVPLTLVDDVPAGLTVTAINAPSGWTCSASDTEIPTISLTGSPIC